MWCTACRFLLSKVVKLPADVGTTPSPHEEPEAGCVLYVALWRAIRDNQQSLAAFWPILGRFIRLVKHMTTHNTLVPCAFVLRVQSLKLSDRKLQTSSRHLV